MSIFKQIENVPFNPERLRTDEMNYAAQKAFPDAELSLESEILGNKINEGILDLLYLLTHPSPLVREGAIYGLQRALFTVSAIPQILQQLTLEDPSATIREIAQDALTDLPEILTRETT